MEFQLTKSQKDIQKAAKEFAKGEFDKEVIAELEKQHLFLEVYDLYTNLKIGLIILLLHLVQNAFIVMVMRL